MAARTGTQLFAKATITDDSIPSAVADQSEINGGWHSVADIAARDATALHYRRWGMVVNVENDSDAANNKQWVLTRPSTNTPDNDGVALFDNDNWIPLNVGAGENGSSDIWLPAGSTEFTLLAGTLLEKILFVDPGNPAVSVGENEGGTQVYNEVQMTNGWLLLSGDYYASTLRNIYFNGVTTETTLKIFKR